MPLLSYFMAKDRLNLTPWDREKLERFVEVGFFHFKRQITARLQSYSYKDNYGYKPVPRLEQEIGELVMEEMLIFSEYMIIMALKEKILDRKVLEYSESQNKKGRSIFITEEECT